MNELIITFTIFITLGFFGILNLTILNDKFLIERESQNILTQLSTLNLNKQTCFKISGNTYKIFDKNTRENLKTNVINNKIQVTTTTPQICCTNSLSCTPSSIILKLQKFTCKIVISIRGQIKKICNRE